MKIIADLIINGAEAMKVSERMRKRFSKHERGTGEISADKFKGFITEEWEVDGFKILTVKKEESVNRHVIFLHGGGYVAEAMASHRRIIEGLAEKFNLKVSFIDYPLAPENKYDKTHEILMKAYIEIALKNVGDEFCLFGDSAGGGLALAFLQELRDKKVDPFPKKTALISPWVDLTMSSPGIEEAEAKDPLFTMDGLRRAAADYAGDANPALPLISPLYGYMHNIGDILLTVGTHEILNPECKRLKAKLIAAYGTSVEFFEGEKMVHDWILGFPFFRESVKALDRVGEFYIK